jgi:hypothetical protein
MTVREYIELLKPYIGVRAYRMLLRAAINENFDVLATLAMTDSIHRGGDPVDILT